jgi:hypothetical protein
MASSLRIFGSSFNKLSGKNFRYSNVLFHGCNDYYPLTPRSNFIDVKSVTFDDCNKNFVNYWLSKTIFQGTKPLEKIYLNSHPCKKNIFERIGKRRGDDKPTVFVNELYSDLVEEWVYFDNQKKEPMKNIVTITSENIYADLYNMCLDADLICNLYNTSTSFNETLYIHKNGIIFKIVDINQKDPLGYNLTKYELLDIKESKFMEDYYLLEYNNGKKERFLMIE